MFETALRKSTDGNNLVLKEAEKLLAKGYGRDEVCGVLHSLAKGLIDDTEAEIVMGAYHECCEGEE